MNQPHPETRYRLLQWTNGSAQAERLAAQILFASGYCDIDPSLPLGGPDGGKDAQCRKNGAPWIMAVYFPRGQMDFASIKRKFLHDLAGVTKNAAQGMAFVTNQALSAAQLAKLAAECNGQQCEVFGLNQLAELLDQPFMASVREQFLAIADDGLGRAPAYVLQAQWPGMIAGYVKGPVAICNHLPYSLPGTLMPFYPSPPNVAACLGWRSRLPQQLVGREAELASLHVWANAGGEGRNVRLRVLAGAGGSGKSRLAFEFAMQLQAQGWQVMHLFNPMSAQAIAVSDTGTLLLIDDAELLYPAIKNLCKTLKNSPFGARLRILLVARQGNVLEQLLENYLPTSHSPMLKLEALPDIDAVLAMLSAVQQEAGTRIAQALPPCKAAAASLDKTALQAWLAQDAQHAMPQMVLALALALQGLNLAPPDSIDWTLPSVAPHWVCQERARLKNEIKLVAGMQVQGAELLLVLAAMLGPTGKLTAAALAPLRSLGEPLGIQLPGVAELKQAGYWSVQAIPQQVAVPGWSDWLAAQMLAAVLLERLVESALIGAWLWQGLRVGEASQAVVLGRLQRFECLCQWLAPLVGRRLVDALNA